MAVGKGGLVLRKGRPRLWGRGGEVLVAPTVSYSFVSCVICVFEFARPSTSIASAASLAASAAERASANSLARESASTMRAWRFAFAALLAIATSSSI